MYPENKINGKSGYDRFFRREARGRGPGGVGIDESPVDPPEEVMPEGRLTLLEEI